MAETQADRTAQLITSPLGGAVFTALVAPAQCSDIRVPIEKCPPGEKLNVFGWSLGGVVGTIDTVGVVVLGFVVAAVVWLAIDLATSRRPIPPK